MALVEARDLVRTYRMGRTEVHALDGLSVSFDGGEFASVMGRSGSGKTTLLNMLGCLDRPTSGSVVLDGVDVTRAPKSRLPQIRREKLGLVFQHFNLIPTLTALENVCLPLKYAGVSATRQREAGQRALAWVGLMDRQSHRPSELSGGEQQRVAIARSLVNRPAIVLADEPTGELDSRNSEAIMKLLLDLNNDTCQTCRTFIIVTHDPGVAAKTEKTIMMNDGMLQEVVVQRASL